MIALDPNKVTIGIELECLLSHHIAPRETLTYSSYTPLSNYWEGHTDASIKDYSRLFYISDKPEYDYLRKVRDDFYLPTYEGKSWKTIELSTAKAGRPIRLSELDAAMDDLAKLLEVNPNELWHHRIQINHSCGAHLHLSIDDLTPMSAGIFNLAKVRYRNWLRENRDPDDVKVFDEFYYRGGYSAPMRAGLLSETRRDFCMNLGIEWRGFHLMKTKTVNDMRQRLHAAFDAFAQAYIMSAVVKEKSFTMGFLPDPTVKGIETKTMTIYNPFPKVLPCAI